MVHKTAHAKNKNPFVSYVDENLEPEEVFVGLFAVNDTTGLALSHMIEGVLLRLDLSITSLRGQSDDGAANMSGAYQGAQALIRKHSPLALFVHCGAHCTNLVA